MSPPLVLTRDRICCVVEKRRARPEGVICVTERRGELCHVEGLAVSVLVSDLRSVFVMVQVERVMKKRYLNLAGDKSFRDKTKY